MGRATGGRLSYAREANCVSRDTTASTGAALALFLLVFFLLIVASDTARQYTNCRMALHEARSAVDSAAVLRAKMPVHFVPNPACAGLLRYP